MTRGSNPKSPREDDELKQERRGHLDAGGSPRTEEFHDPEPPADDDPAPGPAAQSRDLPRELARHMDRTAFPADRAGVLRALDEHHAPEGLRTAAERLPAEGDWRNATEVARAIRREDAR